MRRVLGLARDKQHAMALLGLVAARNTKREWLGHAFLDTTHQVVGRHLVWYGC